MIGWIALPEAWKQCLRAGHFITKEGLKITGLSHGALRKKDEVMAHHWEVKESWLNTYIQQAIAAKPQGYLPVSGAAEKYALPITTIYSWIRSGLVKTDRLGPGHGVIHVREEDIKRNVEHRKNGEKPTAE